jgi:hypothetical protein
VDAVNRVVKQTSLYREGNRSGARRVENTATPPDGSGGVGRGEVGLQPRRGGWRPCFKDRPEFRRCGRSRGWSHGRLHGLTRTQGTAAGGGRVPVRLRVVDGVRWLRASLMRRRSRGLVGTRDGHGILTTAASFGGREERSGQKRSEHSGEEPRQGSPRRGNHRSPQASSTPDHEERSSRREASERNTPSPGYC